MPQVPRPMLASLHPVPPLTGERLAYEPKYDGVRTLAEVTPGAIRLWSRTGNDKTAQFPEIVRALDRFARLTGDQVAFLEVFIKNRGVIKDVEAELGISYPTVRARLDEVIRGLGFAPASDDALRPSQVREERRIILEALRSKQISADEAASRLATLGERSER